MKTKRGLVIVGLLVVLGLLALVTACGTPALENMMLYQGRLTNAGGTPINGSRNLIFRLFTTLTGGTSIWQETHNGVQVTDGLFQVVLGQTTPLDEGDFHQPLWVETVVSGQALSPRQPLYGAPYAFSLVPGAVVKGYIAATDTYSSTLTVANFGDGHGVSIYSDGTGLFAGGTDAAIYASGAIQSSSKSYVWVSGTSLVKNLNSDSTRWDMQNSGAARVFRGGTPGGKVVYYPITLPGVLYGQPVKVTNLRVYYVCEDGSDSYITATTLRKQTDADSALTMISNGIDRKAETATSYSLNITTNNTLSSTQGALGLYLTLTFANDTDHVQIGGIRLEIEHD